MPSKLFNVNYTQLNINDVNAPCHSTYPNGTEICIIENLTDTMGYVYRLYAKHRSNNKL